MSGLVVSTFAGCVKSQVQTLVKSTLIFYLFLHDAHKSYPHICMLTWQKVLVKTRLKTARRDSVLKLRDQGLLVLELRDHFYTFEIVEGRKIYIFFP